MKRTLVLVYGVVCYLIFFATFLYLIGFLSGLIVPKSISSGATGGAIAALMINAGLLLMFGLQHSVMARPQFKERWTKIVPKEAERSTYVLFSSLALMLLFWQWRPIGGTIWSFESETLRYATYALFFAGFGVILYATCLLNHFDLFGLRQCWLYFRGKEYTPIRFNMPGAYKYVRHPLYIGWLIAIWATPDMGFAHWVFATGTTAYIFIAVRFEERDLVAEHGNNYLNYRRAVPMMVPRWKRELPKATESTHQA